MAKNILASAEDARDMGLIPGSRRSPGEGKWQPTPVSLGNPMDKEEPGGLQPMGLQRLGHN